MEIAALEGVMLNFLTKNKWESGLPWVLLDIIRVLWGKMEFSVERSKIGQGEVDNGWEKNKHEKTVVGGDNDETARQYLFSQTLNKLLFWDES